MHAGDRVAGMSERPQRRATGLGHPLRTTLVVVVILVVGAGLGVAGVKAFHSIRGTTVTPGSVALASAGYGLATPASATVAGGDLFIANEAGNSVSVVNASNGTHVATIAGSSFGLDHPTSTASVGSDVFVANSSGNSVTEIDAGNRSPLRIVSGPQYGISDPIALSAAPGQLFVLSADGGVTEVSATTGGLVGVLPGSQLALRGPSSLSVSGDDLFVTDSLGDSVTEIDTKTMAVVRTLRGPAYGFHTPTGAVIHGGDLWVTNATGDSVTQIAVGTGNVLRVIVDHTNLPTPGPITAGDGYVFTVSPPGVSPMVSQIVPANGKVAWMMCNTNGPYLFANPQAAVVSGSHLWVVNRDSNSLTEMDTDSGALIRTIS